YPALGATTSSLLTSKDLPLPGFIGIGGTAQRIGPGFLGMNFAPFTVQNAGQPPENIKSPGSLGNGDGTTQRPHRRQRLFYTVEENFNQNAFPHLKSEKPRLTEAQRKAAEQEEAAMREAAGSAGQAHQAIYKKAFDLTISPLRTVFEVNREPAKVID